MYDSLLSRPNYPSPPQRSFDINTFPNDLITKTDSTNNREYYTQIDFYEYNSSTLGQLIINGAIVGAIGAAAGAGAAIAGERGGGRAGTAGALVLGLAGIGFSAGAVGAAAYFIEDNNIVQGYDPTSKGTIKLPIPQRINDTLSFSWREGSLKEVAAQLISTATFTSNRLYIGENIGKYGLELGLVTSGYAINPLFYQAFQNPNFRTFQFNWLLAPRTKAESNTISKIISMMKQAASPSLDGIFIKYPMIAMIKFFPNGLNGSVVLKPCIIQGISVDYTASGGPSFFAGREGAPTIVSIGLSVKELQLWYREDFVELEKRM